MSDTIDILGEGGTSGIDGLWNDTPSPEPEQEAAPALDDKTTISEDVEADEDVEEETPKVEAKEVEGEEEVEEEEEKPKDKPEERATKKTYKATNPDGSQVELDSDTEIKIKVDGKFQKVKFEDLKKDYNGRIYHDERVRRASEKEKEANELLIRERKTAEKFSSTLKVIDEDVSEKNILSALAGVAELMGQDPADLQSKWITSMSDFISEFAAMNEIERRAYLAEHKYAQLKGSKEKEKQKEDQEAKLSTAQVAIDNACTKYKVSREDVKKAYDALTTHYEAKGLPSDKITLDDTVSLLLQARVRDNLIQAQKDANIQLSHEQYDKIFSLIYSEEKDTGSDLELSDYIQFVTKVTSEGKQEASEGLKKKVPITTSTVARPAQKASKGVDINELW